MVNKILIDTNVLIDYLLERKPFFEDAKAIILSCVDGKVKGCIAAHSIPNIFYILRKDYRERNVSDYATSEVKAIEPKEYMEL